MNDQLEILNNAPQISTVELRKNLSKALGEANYGKKPTLVTHHGKPMAAIVPVDDYVLLMEIKRLKNLL